MPKVYLALTLLLVIAPTGVIAQHGGTDKEQQACTRDVQRFCRKLMDQGDFAVLACLKQNRARLFPACRYVLVSHGQ